MKLLIMILAVLAMPLFANQPHKLNFQGILTDNLGAPVVDSNYTFGFSIYDAEVAGNKLWEETKALSTSNGIYQTTLGNESTLATLPFDKAYYVQITVNNTVLPLRTKLITVPYAISANTVTGNIAATTQIADSLVVKGLNGLTDHVNFQVAGQLTITTDPASNAIIVTDTGSVIGPQGPAGPQGSVGVDGAPGVDGADGLIGSQGIQGEAGFHCWDINMNRTCDLGTEDINSDKTCDFTDCRGPALQVTTTCDSLQRSNNGPQDPYTCMDSATQIIYYYQGGSSTNYLQIGKITTEPEDVTHWNEAYNHVLPVNDSLHFTSAAFKLIAEQNASNGRDGYLLKSDFIDFRGAADSISILAFQDTSFYNELAGFDTDIYDSIGRATTLLSTSISQLSGSIDDMWTITDDSIYTTNRTVINSNSLKAPLTINKNTPGNMIQAQRSEDGGNIYLGSGSGSKMWPVIGGVSEMTDKGLGIYAYPHDTATYTGFTSAAIFMNARQHYNGQTHNYNPLTSGNLLQVANANNVKMTITHDGKIGMGTTSPVSMLHVKGKPLHAQDYLLIVESDTASASAAIKVKHQDNKEIGIIAGSSGTAIVSDTMIDITPSSDMNINSLGTQLKGRWDTNGLTLKNQGILRVDNPNSNHTTFLSHNTLKLYSTTGYDDITISAGLNDASPASIEWGDDGGEPLQFVQKYCTSGGCGVGRETVMQLKRSKVDIFTDVEITGIVTAQGGFVTSDKRFKQNITQLTGSLNKITALNGYSYDWNQVAFPEKNFSDKAQLGLIAQEVEEIVPEAIHIDDDGYYSVDYQKMIPLLIEAIKEQQVTIESQGKDIEQLKGGGVQ